MFNVKTESQPKRNAYIKYIKLCPQLAASHVTSHYSKVTYVLLRPKSDESFCLITRKSVYKMY